MTTHTIYATKRADAVKAYPGAAKIIKVDDAYIAFDTIEDYEIWRNQR